MSQLPEGIRPETAERLVAQARAHGLSVDDYLKTVLPAGGEEQPTGRMKLAEVDQVLDELSEGTEHLAPLPERFSREDIYSDHD